MEYVDGVSVTQLIQTQDTIPEPIIALICKKIVKGLEYLHSNSIIHRDIKSDNVMVKRFF